MNDSFEKWAMMQGWHISKLEKAYGKVPNYYLRYKGIPEEWISFIREYDDLATAKEEAWFLTFNNDELGSFQHDEFEMITLEAVDGDDSATRAVKDFWDHHLVIIMSVGHGYEYYAIDLNTGEVVCGSEPEFEETTVVASSFQDFLKKIITGMITI